MLDTIYIQARKEKMAINNNAGLKAFRDGIKAPDGAKGGLDKQTQDVMAAQAGQAAVMNGFSEDMADFSTSLMANQAAHSINGKLITQAKQIMQIYLQA
ncbi:MAG: hypothetical protein LW817_00615 [Candidatus Caenarcaniphilales bacterium]|nr:hypothetical protein [Candidatus Caenarcaniphilales bacterium]